MTGGCVSAGAAVSVGGIGVAVGESGVGVAVGVEVAVGCTAVAVGGGSVIVAVAVGAATSVLIAIRPLAAGTLAVKVISRPQPTRLVAVSISTAKRLRQTESRLFIT
jgi:hypothetical protein